MTSLNKTSNTLWKDQCIDQRTSKTKGVQKIHTWEALRFKIGWKYITKLKKTFHVLGCFDNFVCATLHKQSPTLTHRNTFLLCTQCAGKSLRTEANCNWVLTFLHSFTFFNLLLHLITCSPVDNSTFITLTLPDYTVRICSSGRLVSFNNKRQPVFMCCRRTLTQSVHLWKAFVLVRAGSCGVCVAAIKWKCNYRFCVWL